MRTRLAHLPALLAASAVLLVLAAAVGWLAAGPVGAVGAAGGVAVVAASYTASTLAIAWADAVNPRLVLPVGLTAYVAKFSLLGVAMMAILDADWAGMDALAAGIVAGVVGWTATQIWWVVRVGVAHPGFRNDPGPSRSPGGFPSRSPGE